MNRTLPEKIFCKVTSNCCPVEGVILRAIFETDFKNNYGSIFGPTDKDGTTFLERQTILHDAAENWKMGLQDYGPIEKYFTGKVIVYIMDEDQLRGALSAYELYKDFVDYPLSYKQNIEQNIEILKVVDKDSFVINAHVNPETVNISVIKK